MTGVPEENQGPVTLATLAELVGVHPSTASRALRGDRRVSPKTIKRVQKLAGDLGYSPDLTGAALRTRRTRIIGALVPRLTDVVLAEIYEAIDEAAVAAGYNTFVANTRDDPALQRLRLDGLLSRRVDGLIIGDSRTDSDLVDELARRNIPFVLIMRRLRDYPSVSTDDLDGGRLAAEHLLSLGHTRVGVITGDQLTSTGAERTLGFTSTYERAGRALAADYVVESSFDVHSGRAAGERLLALPKPPTAIFAVNDYLAVGVTGAVRAAGLRVGHDVALVGYNDIAISSQLTVPLTSVRSPLRDMGRQSVEMLLARLDGEQPASVRLSPTLIARESTLAGEPNSQK